MAGRYSERVLLWGGTDKEEYGDKILVRDVINCKDLSLMRDIDLALLYTKWSSAKQRKK